MIEFKAPNDLTIYDRDVPQVFLAGTIDMGASADWQAFARDQFADDDVILFNPRRDDWNSSWEQTKDNPHFLEQVMWELRHLDRADFILMHFEEGSLSPITLLELGLYSTHPGLVVSCPKGFWRRGNVEICADYIGFTMYDTLVGAITHIKRGLWLAR